MDGKILRSRTLAVIVAFLYSLLYTIIDGIVSNRADGVFISWWPSMQQLMLGHLVTFVCMALLIIPYPFLFLYYRGQQKVLMQMLDIQREIVELDNFLLRGLAALSSSNDIKQDMQCILTKLLRDAAKVFEGRVQRVTLLVPNTAKDDLQHWVYYQMPQGSIEHMKFCVDHEPTLLDAEKKVAEKACISGEAVVTDLSLINGVWVYKGDTNTKRLTEKDPPSISIIAIPLMSGDHDTSHTNFTTCLGVLCFEGSDKQSFSSKEGRLILHALAIRITIALLIYAQYRKIQKRKFRLLNRFYPLHKKGISCKK